MSESHPSEPQSDREFQSELSEQALTIALDLAYEVILSDLPY